MSARRRAGRVLGHRRFDVGAAVRVNQIRSRDAFAQVTNGQDVPAALNERTYLPAVSLRAAFSQLVGNDQLDLRTASFDLAFSKTRRGMRRTGG